MSAEGFALYWAQDAEEQRWATIRGAHVPLDEEGEPTGKVGEKIKRDEARKKHEPRPLATPAPDMARFRELVKAQGGNATKGAHEYFKEFLQDTHMEARTNKGPVQVHFTGGTWKELKNDMPANPVKAELVPHIPNIIATGKYAPEPPAHNHPDVEVVHTYRGTAQTSTGPKEAVVDVMERSKPQAGQQKYQVHSLNHEGSKTFEKRKRSQPLPQDSVGLNHARKKGPTQDSIAAVDENISPRFEVVNLRIVDVTVDEDTIVAHVTARFREWLRAEREALLARDAAPGGCGRVRPGCFTGPFAGLNRIRGDEEELR